jgi:hypothetical protein
MLGPACEAHRSVDAAVAAEGYATNNACVMRRD